MLTIFIAWQSSLNRRHQVHGRWHVDAIAFSAANNRAANGVQLQFPSRCKILLHGTAHPRRHAFKTRLLHRVNLSAAGVCHGACLCDGGIQFGFPNGVRQNLAKIHPGRRRRQRERCQNESLPQSRVCSFAKNWQVQPRLRSCPSDAPKQCLAAGGKVEKNERRSLDEPPRSSPLRLHRNRPWNYALVSKSCPQHRDVFHAVEQGNHATRRRLHRIQRRLQLIGLGGDPQHVDRFSHRVDCVSRCRQNSRRTFQRQTRRISSPTFPVEPPP